MDYDKKSLELHAKMKGKLEIASKVPLETKDDLSVSYTPGVAAPCKEIAQNPENAYAYTVKGNFVAVVTDGSAVLGLGNIGALAGLPVMEGKCLLFKKFGGVDAVPICLATQDTEEIIAAVKAIAPTFGAINLEDIAAPKCFEIEERLKKELNIPVFHDDQHGTAIVTLAGLINALKVVGKNMADARIVMSGIGAAGVAIAKLLLKYGAKNIIMVDRAGILFRNRIDDMNSVKKEMSALTNYGNLKGNLADAMNGADVFIGISAPGLVEAEMVRSMANDAIIFAMANPIPEIMPDIALSSGARVVATGRSDFPNQVNNALVFPGIFRGALDARVQQITDDMKISAAIALASLIPSPTPAKIIPSIFDEGVSQIISNSLFLNR
ncbi:NADP-dependent malic enzyme [Candidatus Peregrinibacteria bacterium]|nr:NADP-dependent malic enzyme [Candidatus Peregrinibacteria bacterium]